MKLALYFVVVVHFVLVLAMLMSFFVLPFMEPWYIALPIDVFLVFLVTNPIACKITELENWLRQKLGMKRIGGFISHYIVKPLKRNLGHVATKE